MNAPRSCARCNSPVFASANACPACGFPVAPPQGPQPPQQSQMQFAATAFAEPPQQTAAAGPIGAAFLPPGAQVPPLGQPTPQAYSPPQSPYQSQPYQPPAGPYLPPPGGPVPQFAPPPAPSGSGATKWLGGCGLAGCLGVAAAGVVGAAILAFVLLAAGSSSPDTSPPPTHSEPGMPSDLPNHGSVRSLIRSQVGSYGLITTAPVTKYPDRLTGGLIDSIGAFYSTPSGGQLTMMALGYSSASAARTHVNTAYDTLVELYGTAAVTKQPVRNKAGVMIGELCTVTEPTGLQHVYWSNSNVMFIATAQSPHAVYYHQASPY